MRYLALADQDLAAAHQDHGPVDRLLGPTNGNGSRRQTARSARA